MLTKGESIMAQSLKHKIRILAEQFNIDAVISTAQEVKADTQDSAVWDAMSDSQKTQWFEQQCAKHNLTIQYNKGSMYVNEFHNQTELYFIAWLPKQSKTASDPWHLEIGNTLSNIWPTNRGLKSKEMQIAEVMRLRKENV